MTTVSHATIPIGRIQPHPDNYNGHPQEQITKLRASLRTFGQVESIAVQALAESGGMYLCVAGHGITEAAVLEGFTELRADIIPADWPPHRVKAYIIAANEHARHSSPDYRQLEALANEILEFGDIELSALSFDEGELDRLLAEIAAGEAKAPESFSEYDENIETQHQCPKCGYKWSGQTN